MSFKVFSFRMSEFLDWRDSWFLIISMAFRAAFLSNLFRYICVFRIMIAFRDQKQ